MCYSAKVVADYRAYVRLFGATVDLKQFYDAFWRRPKNNRKLLIARGVEAAFDHPVTDEERQIQGSSPNTASARPGFISAPCSNSAPGSSKPTSSCSSSSPRSTARTNAIAQKKIDWARDKLADLQRTEGLA